MSFDFVDAGMDPGQSDRERCPREVVLAHQRVAQLRAVALRHSSAQLPPLKGRVVLEHGYGYADVATLTPVLPDSRFRLASVTKSLTAAAVELQPRLLRAGRHDRARDAHELRRGARQAPARSDRHELTAPSPAKLTDRLPGEVHYYGQGSEETSGSQSPYRLSLLASLGAAGMVSTAPDLERYLIVTGGAVPGSKPWPVIGGSKYVGILAPPPAVTGYGWEWDGSLPGTSTSMIVQGARDGRVPFKLTSRKRSRLLDPLGARSAAGLLAAGNLLSPPAP